MRKPLIFQIIWLENGVNPYPEITAFVFRRLQKCYDLRYPNRPALQRAHASALFILNHFLGEGWVDDIFRPTDGFLSNTGSDQQIGIDLMRVVQLGEMLINLRHILGIEAVVGQLKGGMIESAYAELEVGKLLACRETKFRFVIPQGKKRDDYDIKLLFPEGMTGCR